VNATGEQEVSETNDAFSDTEAEAIVANNSIDAVVVDDYIDGLTINMNVGSRSQGCDDLVQVAVLAEAPESCTGQYFPTVTVADVHVSAPPVDMNDVELSTPEGHDTIMPTSNVTFRAVSPSSLKDVKVPVARRCRGQPKGKDKSLNVKYGLSQSKRKRPTKCANMRAPETFTATREMQKEQCMDPEAVSGANHRCKSGVRKRTLEHAKTITQSVPASAEDHCAECGLMVPRKKAKQSNMINWIQCDKCQFWCHECCVAAMPCSNSDEFVCVRCD